MGNSFTANSQINQAIRITAKLFAGFAVMTGYNLVMHECAMLLGQ